MTETLLDRIHTHGPHRARHRMPWHRRAVLVSRHRGRRVRVVVATWPRPTLPTLRPPGDVALLRLAAAVPLVLAVALLLVWMAAS